MFDISIAQFKKHFVFVCVIIAFSITGILVGFKEFLSSRIFPLTNIDMAYNTSFLFFMSIGVMLPQWILGALLWTDQLKHEGKRDTLPNLPTGRADLQTVTLAISGVIILLCLAVIVSLFWQGWFYHLRSYMFNSFFLSRFLWISDSLLVFVFTGFIWLLCGILCALLYRMALSLTTQTGPYQTLEQRFNMLLALGYIIGMCIWPYVCSVIINCSLILLLSLLPLIACSLWLPAIFSRSTDRSYIKHYELKSGVQERSYLSGKKAAVSILLGGLLFGSYLPLTAYLERIAGFGVIPAKYSHSWLTLFLLAGWYFSYRRELAGRQHPQGVITPLYHWSACCLGLIFCIALSQNQSWCHGVIAIIIWNLFLLSGLFFMGDLLFCLKQLMTRAVASLSFGWFIWMVMFCLGVLFGRILFIRISLPLLGSLLTVIILFFGAMITNGITIMFTSSHVRWHRRVAVYSILPIVFSTLIIFWVTHNWILKKQGQVVNYCETIDKTWAVSLADRGNFWFSQVSACNDSDNCLSEHYMAVDIANIINKDFNGRMLLAGSVIKDIPEFNLKNSRIKCDIIAEQAIIYLPELVKTRAINDFGIARIYWNFEHMLTDKFREYDVICISKDIIEPHIFIKNPLFCHRIINRLSSDGMLMIVTDSNTITGNMEVMRKSIYEISGKDVKYYRYKYVSDSEYAGEIILMIVNPNLEMLNEGISPVKPGL